MLRNLLVYSLTFAVLILTGCTPHLTQSQCLDLNWQQLGYTDGSLGLAPRSLAHEEADCAQYHLALNDNLYQKAWQAGIVHFCQPKNGLNLGQAGKTFTATCPARLSSAFNQAYQRGLQQFCQPKNAFKLGRQGTTYPAACTPQQYPKFANAYNEGRGSFDQIATLQSQLDSVTNQMTQHQTQINTLRHTIAGASSFIQQKQQQLSQNTDPQIKSVLMTQIQQQRAAISQLKQQIQDQQSQIKQLQAAADSLQQQITVTEQGA